MIGEEGIKFYSLLQDLASEEDFKKCTETLSESEREQKGDEELVLRFFAAKDDLDFFKGSVRDWLDNYMEAILLNKIRFEYQAEIENFRKLFGFLSEIIGGGAFVRYRDNSPIGALAPAYFEAVAIGTFRKLQEIESIDKKLIKNKIIEIVQTSNFKDNIGPGANTRSKLLRRVDVIREGLQSLV